MFSHLVAIRSSSFLAPYPIDLMLCHMKLTHALSSMFSMLQHNGFAESLNHQLFNCICAMLHQAGLLKNLWVEAVRFAVWLKNHTLTKAVSNITPYEQLYNKVPNLGGIPEWGQHVWVYNVTGSKLDAQANQACWVGYDTDSTHVH